MARTQLSKKDLHLPLNNKSLDTLRSKMIDHDDALDAAIGDTAELTPPLVTAGAVDPTKRVTRLSVTGTQAYTLANGTKIGQRVVVRCVVAATTPAGTLTPASVSNYTSVLFATVSGFAEFIWNGTAWIIGACSGVTVNGVA